MFDFAHVLERADVSVADVAYVFHTPQPADLRKRLPWIVAERPDLFANYQSVHSDQASKTLANKSWAASFVALETRGMAFAGLFDVVAAIQRPTIEIYAHPDFTELERDFGATDTAPARNIAAREWQTWFNLQFDSRLQESVGRLLVERPSGRRYIRRAETTALPVCAFLQESVLATTIPDWREISLSAADLRILPPSWRTRLREWRGIYLIVDQLDGARYVGSASGAENLVQRWEQHVAGEAGVTVALASRNPRDFRFSILERMSPDASSKSVSQREQTWIDRLDTARFGLNRPGATDHGA